MSAADHRLLMWVCTHSHCDGYAQTTLAQTHTHSHTHSHQLTHAQQRTCTHAHTRHRSFTSTRSHTHASCKHVCKHSLTHNVSPSRRQWRRKTSACPLRCVVRLIDWHGHARRHRACTRRRTHNQASSTHMHTRLLSSRICTQMRLHATIYMCERVRACAKQFPCIAVT